MSKKSIRTAIYVRSSAAGPGAQAEALRAYAKGRGYQVRARYEDCGEAENRGAALERLLAAARRGRIDRVIIADPSRLGRTLMAAKQTLGMLAACGVVVESLSATPSEAADTILKQLLGADVSPAVSTEAKAEMRRAFYSEALRNHAERTARGIALAKERRQDGKRR